MLTEYATTARPAPPGRRQAGAELETLRVICSRAAMGHEDCSADGAVWEYFSTAPTSGHTPPVYHELLHAERMGFVWVASIKQKSAMLTLTDAEFLTIVDKSVR